MQVRVTEVGSVEPQVKVDVKSVLSGKVVELLVREGDRVKRGQVLARVEPDVNQARDLVAGQERGAARPRSRCARRRPTHERNRGLLGQGLLSAQAGLESETRYRSAKAELRLRHGEVPHRPGERRADRLGRGRDRRSG